MKRAEVRARIEEIGIIPGIRVSTPEHARFAAEAVGRARHSHRGDHHDRSWRRRCDCELAKRLPDMVVGAGTVLNVETARRCLDAGATFLTSTGLVLEVVEFALKHDVVVFPGAMTPTEVIAAWKTGADFVKIYPCGALGGPRYIRALKLPFPEVPLIATGGVNQQTAADFILNGATALGIGAELINPEGLPAMQEEQIHELSRRYLKIVKAARAQRDGG